MTCANSSPPVDVPAIEYRTLDSISPMTLSAVSSSSSSRYFLPLFFHKAIRKLTASAQMALVIVARTAAPTAFFAVFTTCFDSPFRA